MDKYENGLLLESETTFCDKRPLRLSKKSHLFSQQREQKAAHNMYKTRNGFNLFVLQKHTFFGPSFAFLRSHFGRIIIIYILQQHL